MEEQNIYDYVKSEMSAYQTLPVPVVEGYEWSMYKHILTTILYKNSQFLTSADPNDPDRPFKNIVRPILNLQYRTEGFDVKDIELFVNSSKNYYKSMLYRKYHSKWAYDNDIDTLIDSIVESYIDFGGVLVKKAKNRPEIVPLQSLAFCDQTDILSGTFAIKHSYSPDQLLEMKKSGWGKFGTTIEELIKLAENSKTTNDFAAKKIQTPSKYIEVYEVHGVMKDEWLNEESESEGYCRQMHIIAYYSTQGGEKKGVTLYKGKEKDGEFKFLSRDAIYGRALGFGGAEELFEAQVWTNYSEQKKQRLLENASKVIFQTTDRQFKTRQRLDDLDNNAVVVTEEGSSLNQLNLTPTNITLFENSLSEWESHAQRMGSANDSNLGVQPTSGTPFKLQELVTNTSNSLHEYRQGKISTFVTEIYRDWIIPMIAKDISSGVEFLADFTLEEVNSIVDSVTTVELNRMIIDQVLSGKIPTEEEQQTLKSGIREDFAKTGNKHFIKLLENEMTGDKIDVYVNIAGKQKNVAGVTDKLVNVFRQVIANPTMFQQYPFLAKPFNEILELSGLNQIDFTQKPQAPTVAPPQEQQLALQATQ